MFVISADPNPCKWSCVSCVCVWFGFALLHLFWSKGKKKNWLSSCCWRLRSLWVCWNSAPHMYGLVIHDCLWCAKLAVCVMSQYLSPPSGLATVPLHWGDGVGCWPVGWQVCQRVQERHPAAGSLHCTQPLQLQGMLSCRIDWVLMLTPYSWNWAIRSWHYSFRVIGCSSLSLDLFIC